MKKTEYISFRTDEETKQQLAKIAASRKWSISLLVEDIVQTWLEEQKKSEENE
ncbi:MAG: hypothetical protein Q4F17_00385 [Eubacteriales bacterium]|nr:hypothetical protein [Eubacteriales bacterium]